VCSAGIVFGFIIQTGNIQRNIQQVQALVQNQMRKMKLNKANSRDRKNNRQPNKVNKKGNNSKKYLDKRKARLLKIKRRQKMELLYGENCGILQQ
jgi:hypothetical protein